MNAALRLGTVTTFALSLAACGGEDGASSSSWDVKSGHAQCLSGETVVGGGWDSNTMTSYYGEPIIKVIFSRPANTVGSAPLNGAQPTGWYVEIARNSGLDSFKGTQPITLYVLCASAG